MIFIFLRDLAVCNYDIFFCLFGFKHSKTCKKLQTHTYTFFLLDFTHNTTITLFTYHQNSKQFKHTHLQFNLKFRLNKNFHCRVWAKITILASSYKSYDHMSPLEGRVHHIDYMLIHLSCMHRDESRFPHPRSIILDWEKWENKEWGSIRLFVKRKLRASNVK
jgi:hypothetical protein